MGRFKCYDCGDAAQDWTDDMNTVHARNVRLLMGLALSALSATVISGGHL